VTQGPAVLQNIFLTTKTPKNKKSKEKKKKPNKRRNLYIKTPKDAANSQILFLIKYSQLYPAIITHFSQTGS
jgi:hypothetical protein